MEIKMKSVIVILELATNPEVTADAVVFTDKVEKLTLGVVLIVCTVTFAVVVCCAVESAGFTLTGFSVTGFCSAG